MYRYVGNDPVNLIDSEGRKASQASDGANFLYYDPIKKRYLKESEVTDITIKDFFKIIFGIPAVGALGSIGPKLISSKLVKATTYSAGVNFTSGVIQGYTDTALPPGIIPSINPITDPLSSYLGERLGEEIKNRCGK